MSFARHGTMANLESTLALRQAQFVTSQPGVTTHEDDDLQYMRSSFHSVRDSLLGASRPAAAATFGAASGQRRSPPKAADRVPDYSIAHPVSRPARELGLLVHPDQVPIPCTHTAVLMRVHTPHMHVHCTCIAHDQHAHRVFPATSDAEYVLAQAARANARAAAQRAADTARATPQTCVHRPESAGQRAAEFARANAHRPSSAAQRAADTARATAQASAHRPSSAAQRAADTARAIARASPHRPSHRPASHMHYAAAPTTREGTCAGPTTPSRAPSRPPNLESVRQARYSLSVSCHKPRLPHALVSYSSPDSSPSGTQGCLATAS
eukprot:scaffold84993_cov60-Phaeocystis_antarctica.AAC.3